MGHRPIQQKHGPLTIKIAIFNLERMAHWNFKFIGNKWKMAHTMVCPATTLLLFDINVVLMLPWWTDVTIVESDIIKVVPWQLSTGSKYDYLFCYCPPSGYSVWGTENWWKLNWILVVWDTIQALYLFVITRYIWASNWHAICCLCRDFCQTCVYI